MVQSGQRVVQDRYHAPTVRQCRRGIRQQADSGHCRMDRLDGNCEKARRFTCFSLCCRLRLSDINTYHKANGLAYARLPTGRPQPLRLRLRRGFPWLRPALWALTSLREASLRRRTDKPCARGARRAYRPAAAFKAAALSVRSHVNSGSSRPKWP